MYNITDEQKSDFLKWSEGNKYLFELLLKCKEYEITTFASCGGHLNKEKNPSAFPYIGIILNEKTLPFIRNMLFQIQDMSEISILSGVRVSKSNNRDDNVSLEQLRTVFFYGGKHNCCELFYKLLKGIENKDKDVRLNEKASKFYDDIKKLSQTSKDEILKCVNDNVSVNSAYDTTTKEFMDYTYINLEKKGSRLKNFLIKHILIQKMGRKKYKELHEKYGYLQREYIDLRSNFDEQLGSYVENDSNYTETPSRDITNPNREYDEI